MTLTSNRDVAASRPRNVPAVIALAFAIVSTLVVSVVPFYPVGVMLATTPAVLALLFGIAGVLRAYPLGGKGHMMSAWSGTAGVLMPAIGAIVGGLLHQIGP